MALARQATALAITKSGGSAEAVLADVRILRKCDGLGDRDGAALRPHRHCR